MLISYLKIAVRYLLRQKVISFINIFGLSVSLAVSLLLFLFISFEFSYDSFHANKNRIYRFVSSIDIPDGEILQAPLTTAAVPEEISHKVVHIDRITKLEQIPSFLRYNENTFKEIRIFRADNSFFQIFSFKTIEGDPYSTLSRPNEVVITRSAARKTFGNDNPIGKIVTLDNEHFEVTALIDDIPENSHIKFDLITSFLDIKDVNHYLNHRGISFHCYFTTHSPISDKSVEMDIVESAEQITNERMKQYGVTVSLSIQKLPDIHLKSQGFQFDFEGTGDMARIYLFGFIALLLFVIAVINFINLIVAKSDTRSREIGLRKVCGAFRKHIITQFLGESILISLISVLFAIVIAEVLLPHFSNLVERQIPASVINPLNILLVIGLGIITGLLAGIYPSLFMSSFSFQRALKGNISKKRGLSHLQLSLVVAQFVITVFLLYGVITLHRQVNYLRSKDLGFDNKNYVVSNLTGKIVDGYQSIKFELEKIHGVIFVSGSESIPGQQSTIQNVIVEGWDQGQAMLIQENKVQDGYLQTLGVPLIAGRDFNPELSSDSAAFILNQTAIIKLGLTNPVGAVITVHNLRGKVIGVTPDYHTRSLHSAIEPLALSRESTYPNFILVNISNHEYGDVVNEINTTIQNYDPSWEISGRFINEFFDGQYRKEEKLNTLFALSSLLSVIIAVMGLFALALFITSLKTKEVGIRKALGAGMGTISAGIAWSIIRWVILSCLIALPIAWYAMDKFLQNFAYRVDQDSWVFVLSAFTGILLALITVIGQTLKVASENPVKALRYE
ncbi:MAG: FtsX-like permease family protein [Bacteroidales bacterium]